MIKAWVFPYGTGPVISSGETIRVTLRTGAPEQGRQVPLPRIEWTKGQSALFNEGRGTMGKKALTVEQIENLPEQTVLTDGAGRLWVRLPAGWSMVHTPARADGETWVEIESLALAEFGPLRVMTAKGSRAKLADSYWHELARANRLEKELDEARREAVHARSAADTAGRTLQAMSEAHAPEWATAELVNDDSAAVIERLTAERDQAQAQVDQALDDAERMRSALDEATATIVELRKVHPRLIRERDQARNEFYAMRTDLDRMKEEGDLYRSKVGALEDSVGILKDQRADYRRINAQLKETIRTRDAQLAEVAAQIGRLKGAWQTWRDAIGALDAE